MRHSVNKFFYTKGQNWLYIIRPWIILHVHILSLHGFWHEECRISVYLSMHPQLYMHVLLHNLSFLHKLTLFVQFVFTSICWIPYIRIFMRHVFSANSTLKQYIKSTRINISRNHSKSLNLPDLQETVSNLHECIFSWLWYSREQSGKWMHAEKTWYMVYVLKKLHYVRFFITLHHHSNCTLHMQLSDV